MKPIKLYISGIIAVALTIIPITKATAEPIAYIFSNGSGDRETRIGYLEDMRFSWGNNADVLREPSPKLLSWYEREQEFVRDWVGGEKKDGNRRADSFFGSSEYAHVELFYALQRVDEIINNIELALEKNKPESELYVWIALSAEVSECSDLNIFAERLEKSKEISSEAQQSISTFCQLIPNLHRNIIMPFYANLYF